MPEPSAQPFTGAKDFRFMLLSMRTSPTPSEYQYLTGAAG
jgi:hypothetical protein